MKIEKTQKNRKCKLCRDRVEMVKYVSEFGKLTQKDYKT